MQFNIEKQISNLIESQFPRFYQEEGPNFILFVKAYYEWMEGNWPDENGQKPPIHSARRLFDYRDIDNTLEKFLEFFQKKYLYGIPFNIIVNKRFLLKHILDVYRSKGTIECYKLLFKLIYNEDVEIYLPNKDIFKPSNGTWTQPKYLEVTDSPQLKSLTGKTIVGLSSRTEAVVESVIEEAVNQNRIASVFISNILPVGGEFVEGEKIVVLDQLSNTQAISEASTITGSLNYLKIINGGFKFKVGDILGIAHRDPLTNDIVSNGIESKVIVTQVTSGNGALSFTIVDGGYGYNEGTKLFLYNSQYDTTGREANFSIGGLSSLTEIEYNTDLFIDYANLTLDSVSFGFPGNPSANISSVIGNFLDYKTEFFGSIRSLTSIQPGTGYIDAPNIFAKAVLESSIRDLSGTVTYSTTSNTVTGVGTSFLSYFSDKDVIYLSETDEYHIIQKVVNDTTITLYGTPAATATGTGGVRIAPPIYAASFASNNPLIIRQPPDTPGADAVIVGFPASGNDIIANVAALDSGRGYLDEELVTLYSYNSLSQPVIAKSGSGYSNGDLLLFVGGSDTIFNPAKGYVKTNKNGSINEIIMTTYGSGYKQLPEIQIKTVNGNGAIITTTIEEYNSTIPVSGLVVKTGTGVKPGYWKTTDSFLNADKYIQDSHFYQDYSYQIKVAAALDKYKNILYNTFHPAGSEMFGKFQQIIVEASPINMVYETDNAELFTVSYFTVDNDTTTVDNTSISSDRAYFLT